MKHSVVFNNVTKKYKIYQNTKDRLKGVVAPKRYGEDFYAVRGVTFTAEPGDVIGVVGVNGAGKSTLSNLIAGVAPQTSGEITINGKAAIIAISSGLDNDLSGRDNIEYKCLMLGFKKKQIQELTPVIIDFADIGNFIDQPVKSYSSGMKSRLGFAISVNVDPDVLVIDEALSVGDQTFKEKCYDKMNEFKEKGKTIFFVSHSIREIKNFCQKVLWLEAGEVRAYGTKREVILKYRSFLTEFKSLSDEEKRNFRQHVIEKRSKEYEAENGRDELLKTIPRKDSRIHRNKKSVFRSTKFQIIIFLLLFSATCVAAFIVKPWEVFFTDGNEQPETYTKDNNVETDDSGEVKASVPEEDKKEKENMEDDIRYVMVESASIRSNPNLDGEVIDFGNFGEAYKVKNTSEDVKEDIQWLKVTNLLTDETGWISGNVMMEISKELNDAETAGNIQKVIGSHSILDELSRVDLENGGDYLNVKQLLDKDRSLSIPVLEVSESDLISTLDEAQLEVKNKLLYHGSTFDFVFTLENEKVQSLNIVERQSN